MLINSVLFVDDEDIILDTLSDDLKDHGYDVTALKRGVDALSFINPGWPGILITDIKMPGMDGLALMQRVNEIDPDIPVILITGHGDVPLAVEAMRNGAFDFIEKPCSPKVLLDTVNSAIKKRKFALENRKSNSKTGISPVSSEEILGVSPPVLWLKKTIHELADSDADVLISGETGTGKELVARCLHFESKRKNKNFVAVNCGALPESIIENELFGHEEGAFTGASRKRIGKFEYAHEGTIFLDEIESMPLQLQVKLLRVLQERTVERLGSNDIIPINVRIIAAAKIDLKKACEENLFREDLFYRLNVVSVYLAPLRERIEDIPLLFRHFIDEICLQQHVEAPQLQDELIQSLMSKKWPGNIRELKNEAGRFVFGSKFPSPIPPAFAFHSQDNELQEKFLPLTHQVNSFEKNLLTQELSRHKGNIKVTCLSLGLPRQTLYDKMSKYGLKRKDFIKRS